MVLLYNELLRVPGYKNFVQLQKSMLTRHSAGQSAIFGVLAAESTKNCSDVCLSSFCSFLGHLFPQLGEA